MKQIPGIGAIDMAKLDALLEPIGSDFSLSLFGSRARGGYSQYSDIDIVVKGDRPIPIAVLARIESDLSESDLPVKVDLVDASRASSEFLDAISKDLIAI